MTKHKKILNFFVETAISSFTVHHVRLSQKFSFASNFRQFFKFSAALIFSIFLMLSFSSTTHAAVMFSEIAWMGTLENANDEWIELYNHDGTDMNVDGWTITDGASLEIALRGIIPSRTIVLLERTDESTVSGITAFQIYTGALGNDGRTLTLKRGDGTTEDRVVGGENWTSIGGDNITKQTPQATMNGWVTGTPTPGAPNVAHGENTNTDDNDEEEETSTSGGTIKGISASRVRSGDGVNISLTLPQTELRLVIDAPETVYVNAPIRLTALPSGIGEHLMDSLVYTWNFGDAYISEGKEVTHAFKYPGEYVVVLRGVYARHDTVVQKIITVLPVAVTLSRTMQNDIVLSNIAPHAIDLSGYVLKGGKSLTFPLNSILLSGKSLTIDRNRVEEMLQGMVALYDTEKEMVASEALAISKPIAPSSEKATSVAIKKSAITRPTVLGANKTFKQEATNASTTATATSPTLRDLPPTIPLYTIAEASGSSQSDKSPLTNKLPYLGLVGILLVSILALYTRKNSSELL